MRFPTKTEEYNALNDFADSHPGVVDAAFDKFINAVAPLPWHMQTAEMTFLDWFMFDYEYEVGHTVARDMAADDPELLGWATAKYTRLVPQVFADGWQIFRDAFDGTPYPLRDEFILSREGWDKGSLGCRVGYDGHDWRIIGVATLHDHAEFDEKTYPKRGSLVEDLSRVLGGGFQFISAETI